MKSILTITIFISSLFGLDLDWEHNYYKALAMAKEQNKDVYLFIGADDCRWCDRYYEVSLSKQEVIDRLQENYILLYMNRDHHKIPNKFIVKGVPRHYFLTPEGNIIYEDRGSREPEGVYIMMDQAELNKED